MEDRDELPPEVVQALLEGRKVAAIKILRAKEQLDLREAKIRIDKYLTEHPERFPTQAPFSGGRFMLVALVVIAVLLTYRMISDAG